MSFSKESDLAGMVVEWLSDEGWDVYQEVEFAFGVADIIATQGQLIWAVETKNSLSLEVLGQAHGWKRYCHFVSVAVPTAKRRKKGSYFADYICCNEGIGVIRVCDSGSVREMVGAKLNRKAQAADLRKCLCEEHKTFARAGNADGLRWTTFKATCHQLRKFVLAHPGCSLKEAIDGIKHHYSSSSSAIGSLRKWLHEGVVEGVEMQWEGRKIKLYAA